MNEFKPDPSVHTDPERVKYCAVCNPKPKVPVHPWINSTDYLTSVPPSRQLGGIYGAIVRHHEQASRESSMQQAKMLEQMYQQKAFWYKKQE